jgi:hypothetical protein
MSSSGLDKPDRDREDDDAGWAPPLWLILLALVALVAALIVGAQLFGVLHSIIFPPQIPLPAGVVEVEHANEAFGADRWRYETTLDPCSLAAFYREQGGVCVLADDLCGGDGAYHSTGFRRYDAVQCTGFDEFSVFGLRWQVNAGTHFRQGEEITTFALQREILWSGPPAPTSTPPPE